MADQFKFLFCDTKVANLLDIANHVVNQHPKNSMKYFEQRFCHSTGKQTYTPVQFNLVTLDAPKPPGGSS